MTAKKTKRKAAKNLPAKVVARIEALASDSSNHTIRRMRDILTAEGIEVSRGKIGAIAKRVREQAPTEDDPEDTTPTEPLGLARLVLELVSQRRTPKAETKRLATLLVEELERQAEDDDVGLSLRSSLASLRRAAQRAERDGDLQRTVAAAKAAATVAGLITRHEQAESEPDEDDADMVALGEQAWGRFEAMIEQAAEGLDA